MSSTTVPISCSPSICDGEPGIVYGFTDMRRDDLAYNTRLILFNTKTKERKCLNTFGEVHSIKITREDNIFILGYSEGGVLLNRQGQILMQITGHDCEFDSIPYLHPTLDVIAFSFRQRKGESDFFLINSIDGIPIVFESLSSCPSFSPDGSLLFFVRFDTAFALHGRVSVTQLDLLDTKTWRKAIRKRSLLSKRLCHSKCHKIQCTMQNIIYFNDIEGYLSFFVPSTGAEKFLRIPISHPILVSAVSPIAQDSRTTSRKSFSHPFLDSDVLCDCPFECHSHLCFQKHDEPFPLSLSPSLKSLPSQYPFLPFPSPSASHTTSIILANILDSGYSVTALDRQSHICTTWNNPSPYALGKPFIQSSSIKHDEPFPLSLSPSLKSLPSQYPFLPFPSPSASHTTSIILANILDSGYSVTALDRQSHICTTWNNPSPYALGKPVIQSSSIVPSDAIDADCSSEEIADDVAGDADEERSEGTVPRNLPPYFPFQVLQKGKIFVSTSPCGSSVTVCGFDYSKGERNGTGSSFRSNLYHIPSLTALYLSNSDNLNYVVSWMCSSSGISHRLSRSPSSCSRLSPKSISPKPVSLKLISAKRTSSMGELQSGYGKSGFKYKYKSLSPPHASSLPSMTSMSLHDSLFSPSSSFVVSATPSCFMKINHSSPSLTNEFLSHILVSHSGLICTCFSDNKVREGTIALYKSDDGVAAQRLWSVVIGGIVCEPVISARRDVIAVCCCTPIHSRDRKSKPSSSSASQSSCKKCMFTTHILNLRKKDIIKSFKNWIIPTFSPCGNYLSMISSDSQEYIVLRLKSAEKVPFFVETHHSKIVKRKRKKMGKNYIYSSLPPRSLSISTCHLGCPFLSSPSQHNRIRMCVSKPFIIMHSLCSISSVRVEVLNLSTNSCHQFNVLLPNCLEFIHDDDYMLVPMIRSEGIYGIISSKSGLQLHIFHAPCRGSSSTQKERGGGYSLNPGRSLKMKGKKPSGQAAVKFASTFSLIFLLSHPLVIRSHLMVIDIVMELSRRIREETPLVRKECGLSSRHVFPHPVFHSLLLKEERTLLFLLSNSVAPARWSFSYYPAPGICKRCVLSTSYSVSAIQRELFRVCVLSTSYSVSAIQRELFRVSGSFIDEKPILWIIEAKLVASVEELFLEPSLIGPHEHFGESDDSLARSGVVEKFPRAIHDPSHSFLYSYSKIIFK
ncbi:hypothetical protein ADUPG1_000875 [Aduncisulcus paluster]|uniref:Uncharacterized protein n=1 Tax=Aduncisulcus paluster TaxID=2918883 RepID=A0ABQ5K8B5_9EUKA|nr:hypothetical protein ADUPG1_000875 [Aduncisulcus paluster]